MVLKYVEALYQNASDLKEVDCTGDDLCKGVFPVPDPEPSTVMFQLLGLVIEYTDRLAGTVDQKSV